MGGAPSIVRAAIAVAALALTGVLAPTAPATPAWSALGTGVDGTVFSLLAAQGDIVAGGTFSHAGGLAAGSAASWDGATWTPVGGGMQRDAADPADPLEPGDVNALGAIGSTTYLGGNFTRINGDAAVDVGYAAVWDGTTLSATPVVEYDTIGLIGTVYDIEPAPGGGLYFGGAFQSLKAWWVPGTFKRIAKFDGTSWSPLAVPFTVDESVQGMDIAADGRIAIGTYDGVGGGHVWLLSGGAWTELGPGFDNSVEEVAFGPDGTLYAGGDFHFLDENPDTTYVRGLASWNPSLATWQPVGGGVNGRVHAIAFDPAGRMFVGGDFRYVDNDVSTEYGRIVMRSGGAWSDVGGGVGTWAFGEALNIVEAIAIDPTGRLVAGGSFAVAGPGGATATANIAAIAAAVPAAPTGVSAIAGNARATVTWTALEGQAPVTYTATANGGGGSCSPIAPATSSCTITGLANGRAYRFTVTASNEAATSAASAASSSVTPRPPAPTVGTTTVVGNALVTEVTMRSGGSVTQWAKRRSGSRWIRFCTADIDAASAKKLTLRCPLGRATLQALRKGAVRVSTEVTASPTGGTAVTAAASLRIPKRPR